MKKHKWNIFFITFTFCMCISVIGYTALKLTDAIPTTTSIENQNELTLILDAGHGGLDGGCSTSDGKVEKNINLNITLSVRDLSKLFGYNVETTRDTDKSIHDKGVAGIKNQKISDMENRLEMFNKYTNSICVSIHQNTFSDSKFSGAQMFYSDKNEASEQFATLMQQQFVDNLQPDNQREIKLCGKELYLCYYCNNPAIMVECGFLSNPDEAQKLTSQDYQKKVALTIFTGINKFANI